MSTQAMVKNAIVQLLLDEKERTKKEIEDTLIKQNILNDRNSAVLRNALHALKKEQKITSETKGYYKISDIKVYRYKIREKETDSVVNIDEMKDMLNKISREVDYLNTVDFKRCSNDENICARQKIKMLDDFKNDFLKKYK